MKCEVCDTEHISFAWTDTHGIAQCWQCGTPYRIYHYEGEGKDKKRVEKEPELVVLPEWVPVLRAYWQSEHRRIPGGHSFEGGQELASKSDHQDFSKWVKVHKHEFFEVTS